METTPQKRRAFRNIIIVLLLLAGAFVLSTAPYWKKQIEYVVTSPAASELPVSGKKSTPDRIIVPRFRIEAPIVYVAEENEKMFQAALAEGVVHYPGTAEIGQPGNAYLFGHSSDYIWSRGKFKTVFALLPKINTGDEITVTDREGYEFAYRVIETKIVSPGDVSVLQQPQDGRRLLTLQTSHPIGTALRRFVAIAELVEE